MVQAAGSESVGSIRENCICKNMKKTKCELCDNPPVIWYWYGDRQDPSCLGVCGDHKYRVTWAAPLCFRIEETGKETVEFEQNAYAKRTIDEWTASKNINRHEPRTSDDPVRECLIDAIIEALPIVVSRKLFDRWSLEELKRFSPLSIGHDGPVQEKH